MGDLDRGRATRLMRAAGLDALVLFQPEHVAYAIGTSPGVATMWRRAGGAVALVPGDAATRMTAIVGDLNAPAIARAAPDVTVVPHRIWVDSVDLVGIDLEAGSGAEVVAAGYRRQAGHAGPPLPRPATFDVGEVLHHLAEALAAAGLADARIGVDLDFLPAADHARLVAAIPRARWCDGSEVMLAIRAVKSAREIEHLRRACALAEAGLVAMAAGVRPGQTQADLSRLWRAAIGSAPAAATAGLTGSWDYISVGPDPWGGLGVVEDGAVIKADVGCLIAGQSSDSARTYVFGAPSRLVTGLFAILEDAYAAGIAAIRPGVVMAEVHAVTAAAIHRAGLTGYHRGHFGHSLGANVGMEEWPFLSATSDYVIEPGMVLAFEVPFYGTGVGALMIEDQLLVTDTGIEIMNRLPHGLTRLG